MFEVVESSDLIVFWAVVAARFLLPLLIPAYPLPAIIACLVLDAADQTIFQSFTALSLSNYQGYDKALDIYYLAIAYISTLRNWTELSAFQIGRFLFFYRLVGVTLFELTQLRPLLLVFPNTFEYFFIFYEVMRLWWSPQRLTRKGWVMVAAGIWVLIKLPQEYWIHVAQLDVTDLLGAWWQAQPASLVMAAVLLLAGVVVLWWSVRARLPKPDYRPAGWRSLAADLHPQQFKDEQIRDALSRWAYRIVDRDMAEKVLLVALISLTFAQVLAGERISDTLFIGGVVVVVVVNTAVSHLLVRRGFSWSSTVVEFIVMLFINFMVILIYDLALLRLPGSINLTNTLFFISLLTLIVTLFDRFQQVHLLRFPREYERVG